MVNLSPEESALAGVVVGGLIAWLSAIYVLRRQEKYKAGAEFLSSFVEVLRLLDIIHPNHSHEYENTYDLLRKRHQELYRAALKFKQSLGSLESSRFENTWQEFCCFDKKHQYPTFNDYVVPNSDHNIERDKRALAKDRIEKLLKYAKVK